MLGTEQNFHKAAEIKCIPELTEKVGTLVLVMVKEGELPSIAVDYLRSKHQKEALKRDSAVWMYGEDNAEKEKDALFERCLLMEVDPKERENLHKASGRAHTMLESCGLEESAVVTICLHGAMFPEALGIFVNGLLSSDYKMKAVKEAPPKGIGVYQVVLGAYDKSVLEWWGVMARSCIFGRNMIKQTGSVATPKWMEERARDIVAMYPGKVEIDVVMGEDLKKLGALAIYAVGYGSREEPRICVLNYKGNPDSPEEVYGLVGKGVTFDAGGLNLKQMFIELMHMDKGGSTAVLSAFAGMVEAGVKINLVCGLALAENSIGHLAYKPGDILTSLKGLTIEIGNTDAEGRLCLADTMTYVQQKYKPFMLIDVATLTGAAIVALGTDTAAVFSNSMEMQHEIKGAADEVFEKTWPMPIFDDHMDAIKSSVADIKNIGKHRWGGASQAGAFIKHFVEDGVKWAHIDIAAPSMGFDPKLPNLIANGTGFGSQLLMNYLRKFPK